MIDSAELWRRVSEVELWCSRLETPEVDLARRFRSASLRPVDISMRGARLQALGANDIYLARVRAVEDLVERREKLLGPSSQRASSFSRAMGGMLAFNLDACFFDGAVSAETQGFFDDEDLPPWDTWIAYTERHGAGEAGENVLVSWMPESYRQLAERAIAVHMCNAYAWLES
jgi:hypothetical protein